MPMPQPFVLALMQQVILPDTVMTRVVQERGFLEYTSAILEIVLLLLAAIALGTLVWVLVGLRTAMARTEQSMKTVVEESRPILRNVTAMTDDARQAMTRVREDVERVSDAASAVSEQLLDAAEVTARRIDEVNAVLDVVQDALENVTLASVAAVRGVQVGASEMAAALGPKPAGRRRMPRSVRDELASRRRDLDAPGEVEPG